MCGVSAVCLCSGLLLEYNNYYNMSILPVSSNSMYIQLHVILLLLLLLGIPSFVYSSVYHIAGNWGEENFGELAKNPFWLVGELAKNPS